MDLGSFLDFFNWNSLQWMSICYCCLWKVSGVVQVVEFSRGGTKLKRFLLKNQHTQRKLLIFENWCSGEVSKSANIWLSKSIFYAKNYPNLSQFLFSLKNTNLAAHLLLLTFFDTIILIAILLKSPILTVTTTSILKIQSFPTSMFILWQKSF